MEDIMNNKKPFYLQVNFYLAAAAFVFAFVSLILYAVNCPSEFNGENVSSAVVTGDVLALICLAIGLGGMIAEYFFGDGLIAKIIKYARLAIYVAFISLLISFFMQILDEYSLLGTILYPIFSGTVGDPVNPVLSASYFTSLIFTLIALILAIVSALLKKSGAYGAEVAHVEEC